MPLLSDEDVGLTPAGPSSEKKLLSDADVGLTAKPKPAWGLQGYGQTQTQHAEEGLEQAGEGLKQLVSSPRPSSIAAGLAKTGLGALRWAGSPISAFARRSAGDYAEALAEKAGLPPGGSEFVGNLASAGAEAAVPGLGFTRVPRLARALPYPAGFQPTSATAQVAARASQHPAVGAREEAMHELGQVESQLAPGRPVMVPETAASAVTKNISDAAQAARARVAAAEAEQAQQAAAIRNQREIEARALLERHIEGSRPAIEGAPEAGEIVGQAVRERAAAERAGYRQAYEEAASLPGQFHAGAFEGVGRRIQGDLSFHATSPVIIDDVTTPVASRAIRDLDNISNLRIQNRADPFGAPNPENIVAVDLRGVDQARKRLVSYYQAARSSGNDADIRAARRIIEAFDDQVERAVTNGLFTGDPEALTALQRARASYRSYQQTFRPQGPGDDVGQAMRRIIERDATPEEVARMISGYGRLGQAGLPVRLFDRLETMFGRGSEPINAIRQALWQQASAATTASGVAVNAERMGHNIAQFARSTLAERAFAPQELNAMRMYGQGLRDLEQTIARLPATQAAERARTGYQELFGNVNIGGNPGTLFRNMVEGRAETADVLGVISNAIAGTNPGNVTRLLRAVERVSPESMPAIGEGLWQRMTTGVSARDIERGLQDFLHGRGEQIARQLYTPDVLQAMDQARQSFARLNRLGGDPAAATTVRDVVAGVIRHHAAREAGGLLTRLFGVGKKPGAMIGSALSNRLGSRQQQLLRGRAQEQARELEEPFRAQGGRIARQSGGDADLSPQERALYRRHLANLTGSGGFTNPDGSRSTILGTTVGFGDRTYVVPTVWGGKAVSPDRALDLARITGGVDRFPSYGSEEEAQARYKVLHDRMEADMGAVRPGYQSGGDVPLPGEPAPDAPVPPVLTPREEMVALADEAARRSMTHRAGMGHPPAPYLRELVAREQPIAPARGLGEWLYHTMTATPPEMPPYSIRPSNETALNLAANLLGPRTGVRINPGPRQGFPDILATTQPLAREVIERGRSGRPIVTEPLRTPQRMEDILRQIGSQRLDYGSAGATRRGVSGRSAVGREATMTDEEIDAAMDAALREGLGPLRGKP